MAFKNLNENRMQAVANKNFKWLIHSTDEMEACFFFFCHVTKKLTLNIIYFLIQVSYSPED